MTMTSSPIIRVMLVDDHTMVRRGLSTFLKVYDDLELVGEASSGQEAVQLCEKKQPDVVLMDMVMPDMDGASATRLIRQQQLRLELPDLAAHLRADGSAVLLDHLLADRKAEPGAFRFGRQEGTEDPPQDLRIDSRSRILDIDPDRIGGRIVQGPHRQGSSIRAKGQRSRRGR